MNKEEKNNLWWVVLLSFIVIAICVVVYIIFLPPDSNDISKTTDNTFTLYNYSGNSIKSVYFYHDNSELFGDPRVGHTPDQESKKIRLTPNEAVSDDKWTIQFYFYDSTQRTYSGIELSKILGGDISIINASGDFELLFGCTDKITLDDENTFEITNATGESISEIYIYPSGSFCGHNYLTELLRTDNSITLRILSSSDIDSNAIWNIAITVNGKRQPPWEYEVHEIIGKNLKVCKPSHNKYDLILN